MARIYHDEHNLRGERALVWIVCYDCGKMDALWQTEKK